MLWLIKKIINLNFCVNKKRKGVDYVNDLRRNDVCLMNVIVEKWESDCIV